MNLGGALETVSSIYDGITDITQGGRIRDAMSNAINKFELLEISGSLARLVNSMSVNPIIITTEEARRSPAYDDVIDAQIDIFCSFYISAFKLLTEIYGIPAKYAVSSLNTNRDSRFGTLAPVGLDKQSYIENLLSDLPIKINHEASYRSSRKDTINIVNTKTGKVEKTTESEKDAVSSYLNKSEDKAIEKVRYRQLELTIDINTNKSGYKYNKDTVVERKLQFNATFKEKKHSLEDEEARETSNVRKIVIPILVRASIVETDLKNVTAIVAPHDNEKTFLARWREWRSGGISFLDFLFCNDLIKDYRKNKFKDKEDLLSIINRRNQTSTLKSFKVINGQMGLSGFESKYNMLILGKEDVRTLSALCKNDITKPSPKQKFLDSAHALLFSVLDDDYERVTIYIDDFQQETKTSFKALSKSKGGQTDMTELIKAITMGRSMVF